MIVLSKYGFYERENCAVHHRSTHYRLHYIAIAYFLSHTLPYRCCFDCSKYLDLIYCP